MLSWTRLQLRATLERGQTASLREAGAAIHSPGPAWTSFGVGGTHRGGSLHRSVPVPTVPVLGWLGTEAG